MGAKAPGEEAYAAPVYAETGAAVVPQGQGAVEGIGQRVRLESGNPGRREPAISGRENREFLSALRPSRRRAGKVPSFHRECSHVIFFPITPRSLLRSKWIAKKRHSELYTRLIWRGTLRDDPPTVRFDGRARRYCFGLSAVGLSSALLAVGAFGFEAEAAIAAFGRQKSAATVATSSGGLLSSGEKRNSVDSV